MAAAKTKVVPPRDDVLVWARECLPDYFSEAPAAFHRELLTDLLCPTQRQMARVAPRGHAKSTCATLAYPLWCICHARRRNIVIVTHEGSLARQFLRDIRHELERNETIRARHGDLADAHDAPSKRQAKQRPSAKKSKDTTRRGPRRRRWSQDAFTAANGVTIQARGVGGSFRGARVGPQRPDLVICDDIEKDERVATPEGRAKLEHWLRRVVMPALDPRGQLVVIGSMLHYDSLLAGLADRQRWPAWDYRVYRALEAEPHPPHAASRQALGQTFRLTALWPARWPVERLHEERRRIGTLAFEQEYQANPVDDSTRVFRPEWLRRCSPQELERLDAEGRLVNLVAVDPAVGHESGDYFALWIGAVDRGSGVIYTRELRLEKIGIVEQIRRIVAAFERWRPARIGIETVAYQAALKQMLDEHGRQHGLYMPVVGLHPQGSKRVRIEACAPLFENGTFRLPAALDPQAESQFLHFPKGKHDDAPDVCAMAIELARAVRAVRAEGMTRGVASPFVRRGGW